MAVLLSPRIDDSFAVSVRAAYWAWTLLLQGVLAVGLYFFFRRVRRRFVSLVAAAALLAIAGLPLTLGGVWLDARVVPALYYPAAGGSIDWQESCRMEHAHLLAPVESRYSFLERSGRAWVVAHGTQEPMLLRPEGCQAVGYTPHANGENELKGIFQSEGTVSEPDEFAGFRHTLFAKQMGSHYGETWASEQAYQFTPTGLLLQRPYAPNPCSVYGWSPHERRDIPAVNPGCPTLSGDSGAVASLAHTPEGETDRCVEIIAAPGAAGKSVDISAVRSGFIALDGVSIERKRILLERSPTYGTTPEYFELDFDGQVKWNLPRRNIGKLLADVSGWIWWQAVSVRTGECCSLEWNAGGFQGTHQVARGRSVVAASLHPTGKLIAVSISDRHETGAVQDAVYVIRSRDGAEVFRRNLPPLTKSRVQFLGTSLLAYTDVDGGDGFVRVVRVPERALD